MVGSIKIFVGCMYSGKTTELIRESNRQLSIGRSIININYKDDNRYGSDDYLYSHTLEKVPCVKVNKLSDIDINLIKNSECIFINEGQFFTDLVENTILWCETYNKDIFVSGLDGDYKRQKFGHILDLIPLCNSIVKFPALCSLCKDGTEANFTHRLSTETEQVVIGSSNYIPLCRTHYVELNK